MRLPLPILIAAPVALAVALLPACSSSPEQEAESAITIAVDFLPVNWDPLNGAIHSFATVEPVYDSVLEWNESDDSYIPWLATEYELSDDRLQLSLTLRDDVDFVDGAHLDAAGLKKVIDATIHSDGFFSPFRSLFVDTQQTQLEVTGEYTLLLTSVVPMGKDLFFNVFANIPIVSPLAIDNPSLLAEGPVGSGPYLVDEIVPEVSVSYVRNPDYFNPEAFDFDRVTLVLYSDAIAAYNALKSGQIDATKVPLSMASAAESDGFALHEGAGLFGTLAVLDIAGTVQPALADVRVRQAMNLAFDREAILQSLNLGYGQVSSQAFTAGQPAWVEGGDERYGFDPERARELMAEAGYADGFDVTIPTTADVRDYEPIVQQSLANIGIRVTFVPYPEPAPAPGQPLIDGSYPLMLLNFPYTNSLYFLVFPGYTQTNLITPDLEAAWKAIQTGSQQESDAGFAEAGELILDEAWFVPFSKVPTIWASAPGITVEVGAQRGETPLRSFSAS